MGIGRTQAGQWWRRFLLFQAPKVKLTHRRRLPSFDAATANTITGPACYDSLAIRDLLSLSIVALKAGLFRSALSGFCFPPLRRLLLILFVQITDSAVMKRCLATRPKVLQRKRHCSRPPPPHIGRAEWCQSTALN